MSFKKQADTIDFHFLSGRGDVANVESEAGAVRDGAVAWAPARGDQHVSNTQLADLLEQGLKCPWMRACQDICCCGDASNVFLWIAALLFGPRVDGVPMTGRRSACWPVFSVILISTWLLPTSTAYTGVLR